MKFTIAFLASIVVQVARYSYRASRLLHIPIPILVQREVNKINNNKMQRQREQAIPRWSRAVRGEDSDRVIRIGAVGAGTYAQHHFKVLSALPNVEVSAILTTGGPRGRVAADRFGIPRVLSDMDEFKSLEYIDCYINLAPSYLLREISSQLVTTGKPILMEKPAGYSSTEASALADLAAAHQTWIMVGMNRRFYSIIDHGLAELALHGPIRAVEIDVPLPITVDQNSGRLEPIEYQNMLFRNSIHGVDMARYLLGDAIAVHSYARPNKQNRFANATYAAIIEHEFGGISIVTGFWDTYPEERVRVIAARAALEFEPLDRGIFITPGKYRVDISPDPVDIEYRPGTYTQDLRFVEAVRSGSQPGFPASLIEDAVETSKLIEKIAESSFDIS